MKQAVIAPVYDLDLSSRLSHLYLILSWLCKKDPQYKSYWNNIKRKHLDAYIILDNGANEQQLSNNLELITLANDINVDEIVAPDVYHDYLGTQEKTKGFLNEYYDKYIKNRFNIMAVVQGKTKENFIDCFNSFINDDRINIIGIGYKNLKLPFEDDMLLLSTEDWFNLGITNIQQLKDNLSTETYFYTLSRIFFLKKIIKVIELPKNKKIHLLGLWNPKEIHLYQQVFSNEELDKIRGCDSASPCQAAQSKILFNEEYGVKNKPQVLLKFEERLSTEERNLAEKNIEIMKKWIEDVRSR